MAATQSRRDFPPSFQPDTAVSFPRPGCAHHSAARTSSIGLAFQTLGMSIRTGSCVRPGRSAG